MTADLEARLRAQGKVISALEARLTQLMRDVTAARNACTDREIRKMLLDALLDHHDHADAGTESTP